MAHFTNSLRCGDHVWLRRHLHRRRGAIAALHKLRVLYIAANQPNKLSPLRQCARRRGVTA